MGRIMAIDYGRKRCGVAVTDPLRIVANGLTNVPAHELMAFIQNYVKTEQVDVIVVGEPKDMKNNASESAKYIEPFVRQLEKTFPAIEIKRYDERFTSMIAHQAMLDAGLSRKQRQNKELVDTISATLILQSFMEFNQNQSRKTPADL
ncbi:MAG: Holliday junction resolvase RuvX [Bacteroidales bacterium]|nr:Holliday junction resolvase RuvX [Bacteroidales bacterium]